MSTKFRGELVLKRSFFILLRIDYYLMILSCLGTLERIMKSLEEAVEAQKRKQGRPTQVKDPVQLDFKFASAFRTSLH
jgi:hypothetical protein